jgi:hypothetical protein
MLAVVEEEHISLEVQVLLVLVALAAEEKVDKLHRLQLLVHQIQVAVAAVKEMMVQVYL